MNYNVTVKNKIRSYARSGDTALVFGHGVQNTNAKFVVGPSQAIVFIAPIGAVLSQRALTKRFYEIFSNSKNIERYVSGTLRKVPVFMRDWQTRTYGPGTTCPDLWLEFTDRKWKSMGVLPLPLRGVLKTYSQNTMTSLKRLVGSSNVVTSGLYGKKSRLSALVQSVRGIVFVIACRKIADTADAEALTAHEKAQKLLKRKRTPSPPVENASDVKKQKTRNERLEQTQKRQELLDRLEALKSRIQARKNPNANRLKRLQELKTRVSQS